MARWTAVWLWVFCATSAAALELVAPAEHATFGQYRVVVIGRAKGSQGRIEWASGSSDFSIERGRFSTSLNLPPGESAVTIRVGEETLEARWRVDPAAATGGYTYHPEVGEAKCTACHDPERPPETGRSVSGACYKCHTTYERRKHLHGPVNMGLCTACHDPHGSAEAAFLRVPVGELCTYCHNQPVTLDHRKNAGEAPCLDCHDPHGTNRPYHTKGR